jgi:hypothetical protein
MARFREGDRVYLRDGAGEAPDNRPKARLATIISATESATADHPSYVITIPGIDVPESNSPVSVPEHLLEPGGDIADRYEQLLGPYTDFETMLKQAVSINQVAANVPGIDILGINWPRWLAVLEIRGNAIDVSELHTGYSWAWHIGVLTRPA